MLRSDDVLVPVLLRSQVSFQRVGNTHDAIGRAQAHRRRLIHRSAWRDCMKSSWRSPDGGSSVAPNTKIEPSEAVLCAWWSTASTPIRSFHTVSGKEILGSPYTGCCIVTSLETGIRLVKKSCAPRTDHNLCRLE